MPTLLAARLHSRMNAACIVALLAARTPIQDLDDFQIQTFASANATKVLFVSPPKSTNFSDEFFYRVGTGALRFAVFSSPRG